MKNIIFKKPQTTFYRLEAIFWQLWDQSFFRFLVVGGINTALGYLTTLLLRYTLFIENPKWVIIPQMFEIDVANTVMFLLLFPVSYTLQALLAFKTPWRWSRLFLYPLSSIPNYLIQQGFIFLFETVLGLPPTISYALSAIFAIPLMYVVIRFLVKPKSSLT
jgi:putative flippase GtrA